MTMGLCVDEPKVTPTSRYPIGEAAKLLGCDRGTLRRYCDRGLIKCGFRRVGQGGRFFTGSELLRFWRAQI